MKKFCIYVLFPIFICVITVIFLNYYLDKKIEVLLENKNLHEVNVEFGSVCKDRGVIYNEFVTKNNYTVIQGSSELSPQISDVPQLPSRFFPIKGMQTIVTNGRGYFQNLSQISVIGSENSNNQRKIALVISLQWFANENGIDNKSFQSDFSPTQFYRFLSNENITEEHKKKYASRVDSLLTGESQFASEKLYAKIYTNDSLIYKISNLLFKPYFIARQKMVELKDKGLLYRKLSKLPEKEDVQAKEINWDEEYKKAEEEGKSEVTNNEFMVRDAHYNKYIKDVVKSKKDSDKGIKLMNSKEFVDYELYLDTCVDLGIKPYIILAPTNGRWYDYTGMPKQRRDDFYDKVEQMAESRGFEVLNLKDEEYTPYFMCDTMHLGWKGWLKVDEEIYKHFKEK